MALAGNMCLMCLVSMMLMVMTRTFDKQPGFGELVEGMGYIGSSDPMEYEMALVSH